MRVPRSLSKLWYRLSFKFRKPKVIVLKAILSGNNSFIDIRYWISRPDKIHPKSRPYIVHDKTQERLAILHLAKFGAIQTKIRKDTSTGIILFYNKNTTVKAGDSITLFWDTLRADCILVR